MSAGDVISTRLSKAVGSPQGQEMRCIDSFSSTAAKGLFGGLIFAPLGHAWYSWLDGIAQLIGRPGGFKFLATKVVLDAIVWTPIYVGLFMAYSSLLSGHGRSGVVKKLKEDFLPTVAASGIIWPPVMALIFNFVPLSHQVMTAMRYIFIDYEY